MKKFLVTLSLFFVGAACLIFGACSSNKVQVSFDTDGGAAISSVKLDKGTDYELPVPEKDGFEFEGWYASDDFSGDAVTTVKVTGDVKYYAKWAQLFTVSLDANGGTVSQTSLKLKDGANLYEFLQDYVPVKTDYKFDCWLIQTAPVTPNSRITGDVSLTARYKVKYTVEIYRESLDGQSYVKDSEVLTGYDYVGATVTPEVSAEDTVGFTAVENSNEVVSLELTDTPASNLFKLYYDRENYTVTFRGNYPEGDDEIIKTVQVRYGNTVQLPADTECEGYCLAGWATSASGELVYSVDSIAEKLYGGNGNTTPESFMPENDMGLYAVWIKGRPDMFGGGDVVFLFDETSDKIYLSRGGIFFEGEYYGANGEFSIREGANRVNGRLYPDGTFSYYNADTDMKALTLYKYGVGLVESETVILDGYNGITYRVTGGASPVSSKGTYVIDGDGFYIAEFAEGALEGKTLTMLVSTITIQNSKEDVFLVRDEEKYGTGVMYRAAYNTTSGELTYYTSYHALVFTGFGNAFRNEGSADNYTSLNCSFDGDVLTYSASREGEKKAKILKINGADCYLPYDGKYDFTANNAGDSLTLDGYGNAVWNKNGAKTTGTYTTGTTSFGDFTVTLFANGSANAKFIINSREVGEGDNAQTIYSYVQKPLGYVQYNFADASGVYNGVYVVFDDDFSEGDEKVATVYAKIDNDFVVVSTGTYELIGGLYVYTVKTFEIPDGAQSPFGDDVPDKIVLTVGSVPVMMGLTLPALFCVEYSVDSEPVSTATVYTSADNAKLSLISFGNVGNAAIYEDKNGNKTVGTYSVSSNVLTMTVGSANRYYELNNSANTFEQLMYAPYRIYKLNEKLATDRNVSLSFNGKGLVELPEATYSVNDGVTTTTVKGKVKENDDGTYTFTSDDNNTQVKYKLFTSSSSSAFAVYDEKYAGRYVSEYGTLDLDGYGAIATLTNQEGTFNGVYSVEEDNVIMLVDSQQRRSFYVDIKVNGASRSFTVRGSEYGTFFIYDNAYLTGTMLDFDGYGNLKVYTLVDREPQYIDENGTYTISGDVVTISYDGKNIAGVFKLMQVSNTNVPLFVIIKDEVIGTYVSTSDWAVLVLDGSGRAVKYSGADGTRENGYYTLITDTLLYYYNEDGDDACVYEYDKTTGVATANNYIARGYYTETLESLVFTRFGYAIFNGETRYYYFIEDDSVNNVTIYRRPEEGETGANKYNFVKIENFCAYGAETIEFEGKTYSLSDGFAISFIRRNAELYPVPVQSGEETVHYPLETLSFTPAGSTEFNVAGTVMINGNRYNCRIIRETVNDNLQTYITVPLSASNSSVYFRFDIDIAYGGVSDSGSSNSYYTVTSMSRVVEYESFIYQYNYLMYYYFASLMGNQYGINIENTLGTIYIKTEYDTEGTAGETYIDTQFGSSTEIYDTEGNLLRPQRLTYEYVAASRMYETEFVHTDGYTYRMRFAIQSMQSISGYILHSVVRVQTLTVDDYTVEVETLIASDYFSTLGDVFAVKLKKGEEEIPFTTGITLEDGSVYYISRTTDEGTGKITASDYYKLTFTKAAIEPESKVYPVYTAATVTKLQAVKTVHGADGKTYADVDTVNNEVLYFYLFNGETNNGASYIPKASEYSSEDGQYTVTLANGRVFTVKITEGTGGAEDTVTITEVELPEENEGTQND